MRISQKIKRILTALATVILVGTQGTGVLAAENNILLKAPVEGFPYRIYKVGEVQSDGECVLQGAFADAAVNMNIQTAADSADAALALSGYADVKGIQPTLSGNTGADGTAGIKLTDGELYLLKEESYKVGVTTYRSVARLFTASQIEVDSDGMRVLVVKYESIEEGEKKEVTYTVRKIWDDKKGMKRPQNVTVLLLKNGQVFETVTLSQVNNWTYSFTVLDDGSVFSVQEDNIPEDYVSIVSKRDYTFMVTNTLLDTPGQENTPTSTPNTSLTSESTHRGAPKTGDISLRGPIALIALSGVILLIFGIRFIKSRKERG